MAKEWWSWMMSEEASFVMKGIKMQNYNFERIGRSL